jgi:sec-independent protein translocase protein TatA
MPFGLQPIHLVFIFVVALLIFGPKRLPEIGRGVGKAINEFRRGAAEMTDGLRDEISKPTHGPEHSMASPAHAQAVAPQGVAPQGDPGNFAPAPTATDKFCSNCGSPNAAEGRFCNKCGAQLPA